MLLAASPDWLGSPQHFFGGIALVLAIVGVARWYGLGIFVACTLGVGVTCTAELAVELVEYPVLYSTATAGDYYDTIADMGNTLAGALVGAALGVAVVVWRRRRFSRR